MLLLLGFTPEHLLNFGNFAKILCKSQFSIHKMMFSNSNEPLRFTLFLMGGGGGGGGGGGEEVILTLPVFRDDGIFLTFSIHPLTKEYHERKLKFFWGYPPFGPPK